MRIAAITPLRVSAEELARRQARYDRLVPDGLRVHLINLDGPGAPETLESAADIRRSEDLVRDTIGALDPATYGGVLPDCVLDPAVGGAPRDGAGPALPVFGILRLTAGFLAGCGRTFGSVTRNVAIGEELAARLHSYGADGSYAGNHVLDLDYAAVADDARWNAALHGALTDLTGRGATVVINGCSAVEVIGASGTTVLDPTALALRLLGLGASQGVLP